MKTLVLLILFAIGAGSNALAKDVAFYQNAEYDVSAVITDEPCPKKILELLAGHPDDMAALRYVRVTSPGKHVDACVLPPDADGDYAIFDENKQSGWLTSKYVKQVF